MKREALNILPPSIDCESVAILRQLNKASRALGQLKGEISKIPNAHILLETIILQEAKDSNEIENIVTTDDEIYQASIDEATASITAKETINYGKGIKLGLEIIQKKGLLTINDIKKIQQLIAPYHPVRKIPGTVLKNPKTQEIVYTPPQHYKDIDRLFKNLEQYINDSDFHKIDPLIKMPIIHFQFESIHPFLDGNGRTGRLLNILYLVQQQLLDYPVLYLSSYIIKNKKDYYRLLKEVNTKNSWEEWIIWMLKGVEVTAKETIIIIDKIKNLMNLYKKEIRNKFNFYSHDLINILFKHPYTKNSFVEKELRVHRNTASGYLNSLAKDGMLTKIKMGRSNYYINESLLEILKER